VKVREKPDLGYKITQSDLDSKPKIGLGVDFQAKFSFCKDTNCFGRKRTEKSQRAVSEFLYEEGIKDNHFENLLAGKKTQFIESELKFFRLCFEYVFEKKLMDKITPRQLLTDHLDVLIKRILGYEKNGEYDVDPVIKLLSLATTRNSLDVKLDRPKVKWTQLESTPEFEERVDTNFETLEYGDAYFVDIKRKNKSLTENLCTNPIVIEIGYELETKKKDKLPFRAQNLSTVRQFECGDKEGDITSDIEGKVISYYWRCTKKDNKKDGNVGSRLTAGKTKGHFFFLVIGNGRKKIIDYLPENAIPEELNNDDLEYLYRKCLEIADGPDCLEYGILHYRTI